MINIISFSSNSDNFMYNSSRPQEIQVIKCESGIDQYIYHIHSIRDDGA